MCPKTMGNRILDENNTPVTLRGVSVADPYHLSVYEHHFNENVFEKLSKGNINLFRIPIQPG